MSGLTHLDAAGEARMVDVSSKSDTHRIAVAQGRVTMRAETLALILAGNAKKGDVLGTARLAGSWPPSARMTSFLCVTRSP